MGEVISLHCLPPTPILLNYMVRLVNPSHQQLYSYSCLKPPVIKSGSLAYDY